MDDEIVKEFLIESYESLDQLDQELLALEADPGNEEKVASIFRAFHTIKGTSGFLGFGVLESITHVGENLLSKVRDGVLQLDPDRTSLLLELLDAVREVMAHIEATGAEGTKKYPELVKKLARAAEKGALPGTDASATRTSTTTQATAASTAVARAAPTPAAPTPAAPTPAAPTPAAPTPAAQTTTAQSDAKTAETPVEASAALSEASVRVDVGLLDGLMNLVGELVLARNQIMQHAQDNADQNFVSTTQRLNLITTELQEGVMKTRMQPIANVWNKFPRVVRDLARLCDKEVDIEMEGKETELDRTIIAAIKDPLTHVIRNCVDHGIESPDEREAAGKPRCGTIWTRAFHEGGQVNIEIADDGAGVNPERVKAKALRNGLISAEQAAKMSEDQLANLIFAPGFSTAQGVSTVSGRGVGMDVVKTNIEKIGGTVDLANRPGKGLTLRIKIPLTLAIIPALIVECAGEQFAIPQVNLLELVRLEGDQAVAAVEHIHGAPVYRLRGNLLTLAYLDEELGMKRDDTNEALNIVVLQANDRAFGLVVDGVNDTEEIVVKPLGVELKSLNVYAGTTIMGDGHVALILDVMGVARRAGVVASGTQPEVAEKEDAQSDADTAQQSLLLFRAGSEGQLAIPLSAVARLEKMSRDRVERAGGHDVAQYRGEIMPLIHLGEALGQGSTEPTQLLQIVVYTQNERSVGLVVDEIIDIAHEKVQVQRISNRRGLKGSAVVGGRVTDILDVRAVIEAVDPTFFASSAA